MKITFDDYHRAAAGMVPSEPTDDDVTQEVVVILRDELDALRMQLARERSTVKFLRDVLSDYEHEGRVMG